MNAIKLPVTIKHDHGSRWLVLEPDGAILAGSLSKLEAIQVSTSINCHDELVSALKFYDGLNTDGGHCARAALSKVENQNK